ncbi:MAG: hypothetical protein DMG31_07240 [Acidobacteria bacterium]|jgi:transposase-like protein|nr:MAG: hypothetical protein DMG31_07240 [Acidobacteriota bacterium]
MLSYECWFLLSRFGGNLWSETVWACTLLWERSRKVERKKGQRYSKEFRQQAVERMRECDNIVRLARELGVCRRALYNWRDRFDETNPAPARSRELLLRKQILRLKRLLANKTVEVDFFRHALQRVGARRHQKLSSGDNASMTR